MDTQCVTLTDHNFQLEVLEAEIPVLVDCWASWCGSWHPLNPILAELAIELSGQIKIGRLNIATSEKLAAYYGIRVVPTLLFFYSGHVLERVMGSISQPTLINKLNPLLAISNSSRSRIACL